MSKLWVFIAFFMLISSHKIEVVDMSILKTIVNAILFMIGYLYISI